MSIGEVFFLFQLSIKFFFLDWRLFFARHFFLTDENFFFHVCVFKKKGKEGFYHQMPKLEFVRVYKGRQNKVERGPRAHGLETSRSSAWPDEEKYQIQQEPVNSRDRPVDYPAFPTGPAVNRPWFSRFDGVARRPEINSQPVEEVAKESEISSVEEVANEPEISLQPVEEVAKEPEISSVEEVSNEPEISSQPVEVAKDPEVSSQPVEVAKEPEVSSQPVDEEPEVSSQPVEEVAKDPEVSSQPVEELAQDPEVSSQPVEEVAKEPEVSSQPVEEEPEISLQPVEVAKESEREPEVSSQPVEEPEISTQPVDPEVSSQPVAQESEPETSSKQLEEVAKEPEISSQPTEEVSNSPEESPVDEEKESDIEHKPASSNQYTQDEIANFTLKQLQSACSDHDLPARGTKADLRQRLQQANLIL
jgi:hypothetical protein